MRFTILSVQLGSPDTYRYFVVDRNDGHAVTWSDNRDHAQEWRDLYNEESASPPHMYGEYCECEECTA